MRGRRGQAVATFPTTPAIRYQWHLRQIGMPEAWKLGQGKGAVVAVIDTGVTPRRRSRRHQVRPRLQLHRQQRQRRRRPRPRHARRRHDRAVDQQQARRRRRRVQGLDHADQGAVGARLGLDGGDRAGHPLGGRPRRQRDQHEPRRPHRRGHDRQRREVRARKGRHRRRRGRQRRQGLGELPGALPGRHRGRVDSVRRDDDVLLELGAADRHRRAGRQRARRPERRRQARRRPATHDRPRQHLAHRLPVVHGHVDGFAARRGRRRADRRRRRAQAGRGRGDPARHGPRAQAARRQRHGDDRRRASTTTTAPASSTRRRRCARSRSAAARASWGWAAAWRCWARC